MCFLLTCIVSLPSFIPSQSLLPSVICLAKWELERGFVFFVTVCDVPSDPSKCLKLHYIRLSILPPKPLCHSMSVCEQEEGWAEVLIFPHVLYKDAKSTNTHKNFTYTHKIAYKIAHRHKLHAYCITYTVHTVQVCAQYDINIFCCCWNVGTFSSAL